MSTDYAVTRCGIPIDSFIADVEQIGLTITQKEMVGCDTIIIHLRDETGNELLCWAETYTFGTTKVLLVDSFKRYGCDNDVDNIIGQLQELYGTIVNLDAYYAMGDV